MSTNRARGHRHMLVTDFNFALPDELIAQTAPPRGQSRLLALDRTSSAVAHRTIADLPSLLRRGDLLVVNNTRVFAARLLGHRVLSGGAVECLLLSPATDGDRNRGLPSLHQRSQSLLPRTTPSSEPRTARVPEPQTTRTTRILGPVEQLAEGKTHTAADGPAPPVLSGLSVAIETVNVDGVMAGEGARTAGPEKSVEWQALMHPGQKLKPGAVVRFEGEAGVLMGEVLARHFQGRRTIRLWSESGADIDTLVDALGHVPLPPYIKRDDSAADRERYQTVYARTRGSVAAPTAGLHFTPEVLDALTARGVERAEVTLHVGYGTFKPITVDRVEDHIVDPESYSIDETVAAQINRARAEGRRVIAVGTTTTRALEDAARRGGGAVASGTASAEIFIYPGFEFQVIDGLLTNFHLPKSSLLMLVCAFAGRERVLAAYAEAVTERYRFYSYGDAMVVA